MLDGAAFTSECVSLEAGDVLCLYTDGVTELENTDGEEFGLERLSQVIAAEPGADLDALIAAIRHATQDFAAGDAPTDDFTLVALTRLCD
jgi:serine phosphatase RsbU (regulator of sigma subunit)